MRFSGCRSDIELYHRNKSSLVRPRSFSSSLPLVLASPILSRDKRVVTRHKLAIINYSKQRSIRRAHMFSVPLSRILVPGEKKKQSEEFQGG